jgi:hypothetical protein
LVQDPALRTSLKPLLFKILDAIKLLVPDAQHKIMGVDLSSSEVLFGSSLTGMFLLIGFAACENSEGFLTSIRMAPFFK